MKQTFVYQLYIHSKILFLVVLIFCIGTAITNLRGNEVTPFFVWGMYSKPEKPKAYYLANRIIINDSIQINNINGFTPSALFYINSPLRYYITIVGNNNTDPAQNFFKEKLGNQYKKIQAFEKNIFNTQERINNFLPWYARYLGSLIKQNIQTIEIIEDRLVYHNSVINIDSSYTIALWKK